MGSGSFRPGKFLKFNVESSLAFSYVSLRGWRRHC